MAKKKRKTTKKKEKAMDKLSSSYVSYEKF